MPYLEIKKSNVKNKKWTAVFYDCNKKKVKTVHFGDNRYEDYTQHKNEIRKNAYLNRHRNENWNDFMTAGSLSRWILWEYESFDKAVEAFRKRFAFHQYRGVGK